MSTNERPGLRLRWAIGIATLAVLPHLNAIKNGFTLDDVPIAAENPRIRSFEGICRAFKTDWWNDNRPQTRLYRPLTMASMGIDYAIARAGKTGPPPARLDPTAATPFHAQNVLWHAATSAVFFLLVLELFGSSGLALASAALFAVHPVHTEAVDGIVGRAELMSAFFALLALLVAWRVIREDRRMPFGPALGGSLVFLALLSKEQAIVASAIPFLWFFSRTREEREGLIARPAARRLLGSIAVATLAYVALRSAVLGSPLGLATAPRGSLNVANPIAGAEGASRLLTPVRVFGHALALLTFPRTLSADYSYDQIPLVTSPDFRTVLSALALAGLAAGALLARRRAPAASAGILFLLLSWLVTSNLFIVIGTIFGERLLYLPSAGACLALAAALLAAGRQVRIRGAVAATLTALVLAGSARTWARGPDWKDNASLLASAAIASPRSCKALNGYASELFTAGQPRQAISWAERALAVYPLYPGAHQTIAKSLRVLANDETDPIRRNELRRNARSEVGHAIESYSSTPPDGGGLADGWSVLGTLALDEGNVAEALEDYRKSLASSPGLVPAVIGLGVAQMKAGKVDAALGQFNQALALDPGNAEALQNASAALRELAARTADERVRSELIHSADDEETQAMASVPEPKDASSLANLHGVRGQRLLGEKRFADALAEFREAAGLEPGAARAYLGIGATLAAQADAEADPARKAALADEAIASFARALAVEPNDPTAHMNLGIIYLHQRRDPAKVAEHFRAYLRLVPDAPQRAQMEETIRQMEAAHP